MEKPRNPGSHGKMAVKMEGGREGGREGERERERARGGLLSSHVVNRDLICVVCLDLFCDCLG